MSLRKASAGEPAVEFVSSVDVFGGGVVFFFEGRPAACQRAWFPGHVVLQADEACDVHGGRRPVPGGGESMRQWIVLPG